MNKELIKNDVEMKQNTPVLWIAMIPLLLVIASALIFGKSFLDFTTNIRNYLGLKFGWLYLMVAFLSVVISITVIFRPIGRIKLGDPKSVPEHSTFSWIAMLFSAGMGIGLVFYGAAEPLSHYAVMAPEAKTFSQEALRDAFKYSFFHYGISAWAIYGMVALSVAYFQFRKKERTNISATLKTLLGQKTDGLIGHIVDAVAIFATVIGVATSLGIGAIQINSGLSYVFKINESMTIQLIIILVATFLFLLSAVSGIGKGVKILSNLNILLAILLMVVAIFIGPGVKMINTFIEGTGAYLNDFIRMSFRIGAFNSFEEQQWIQKWTIVYWAWWISWSPFVGLFIARISKGRTIREFLTYVLIVPSLFSFLWFSVFGTLGAEIIKPGTNLASLPLEQMLFGIFEKYPLSNVLSIVAIFLVFSFFITSADSATFVLSMLSENGTLNPSNKVKILWGLVLSGIAGSLLAGGGLDGLQNVLIIIAFPFTIILIFIIISLIKELSYERKEMGLYLKPKKYPTHDEPFRSYTND